MHRRIGDSGRGQLAREAARQRATQALWREHDPNRLVGLAGVPAENRRMGSHGVGMGPHGVSMGPHGVSMGPHGVGVGMGLAWGWHGVGMGLALALAWGWHGAGMGLAWLV
jgi:hypothetical protein